MITQEEARVRIGVDGTQVAPGLQRITTYIETFGDRVGKKLTSLISANLWMSAANLAAMALESLIPTAEKFWDEIYGNSPAASDAFAKTAARLRTLRESISDLEKSVADKEWQRNFKGETPEGQTAMLDEKIIANAKAQAIAKKELEHWKMVKAQFRPGEFTDTQEQAVEEMGKAEEKLLTLQVQSLDLAGQQKEVEDKKLETKKEEEKLAQDAREAEAKNWRDRMDREVLLGNQMQRTRAAEFTPTLGQLSDAGSWRKRFNGQMFWQSGPFARQARELQQLEADAPWSKAMGNTDRFNMQRSRIDELRKQLSEAGVYNDPMKEQVDELKGLRQQLRDEYIKVELADDGS